MKRFISMFLMVALIASALSCISVSAEEKYPPVETGTYSSLRDYEFETAGENSSPITLDESSGVQLQVENNPISIDQEVKEQIERDYVAFTSNQYTVDQIDVSYYGTLSDGSMIVHISRAGILLPQIEYTVIGKYVYITGNKNDGMVLYKDRKFKDFDEAYLDGSLTDELLDELAVTLSFAKFVNPNEVKESPTATADTATADTSANNANGSIPTGANSSVIMLSIIALAVSSFALCLAKRKN